MSKVISFLDNYYQKAIKLSNDFSITRTFEWTPLLILNELSIQIGHIYNIVYQSEAVNEPNRSFNNLGDELSDVFLQLIALADSLKINMYDIKDLKPLKEEINEFQEAALQNRNNIELELIKVILANFINDVEKGVPKSQIQKQNAFELYDRYLTLGGNSYIHENWKKLLSENKL